MQPLVLLYHDTRVAEGGFRQHERMGCSLDVVTHVDWNRLGEGVRGVYTPVHTGTVRAKGVDCSNKCFLFWPPAFASRGIVISLAKAPAAVLSPLAASHTHDLLHASPFVAQCVHVPQHIFWHTVVCGTHAAVPYPLARASTQYPLPKSAWIK